jgi:hypothetical protein
MSLKPLKYNTSVTFCKDNLSRHYINSTIRVGPGKHAYGFFVIILFMGAVLIRHHPLSIARFLQPYLFPLPLDVFQNTIDCLYVICFYTEYTTR